MFGADTHLSIGEVIGLSAVFLWCVVLLAIIICILNCLCAKQNVAPPDTNLVHVLDVDELGSILQMAPTTTNAVQKNVAPPDTNPVHVLDVDELRSILQMAPTTTNAVQVWECDTRTVERFLQELANEKPIRFTCQQLRAFTNDYSVRLGSGGFGDVYEGHFPNGVKIAVKLLKRTLDKSTEEQFMAEVGTIGRTYHRHLVRLYGFCYDKQETALVYEYMENGSLDKYLSNDTDTTIEWEKRHEIAVGAAKAIAYLHEECQQRIIHYDIKPGNVLLDENFSPKVADFGLAKLCNPDKTHITFSRYRGTPGYSAPEFIYRNFPITYKCDVYSYGILLFEIVGGRKNTNSNMRSSDSLDWFPKHVWEEFEKGSLATITTSCGVEEKGRVKAERMCKVALWCVQDSPDARPPMSAVVQMLEGEDVEIVSPPRPFNYLFSMKTNAFKLPGDYSNSSDYSTSEATNSYWYIKTHATNNCEIQNASS